MANTKKNEVFTVQELSTMEEALKKLNRITEPSKVLTVLKATRPFMHAIQDIRKGADNFREEATEKLKPFRGKEEDEDVQKKIRKIEAETNDKLREFQKNEISVESKKLKYEDIKDHVKLDVNDLIALERVIDIE